MILLLIKGILGSGVFWAFYALFLDNEKNRRFNRFYLLLTPPLALAIPFIPLPSLFLQPELPGAAQLLTGRQAEVVNLVAAPLPEQTATPLFVFFLLGAYLSGAAILLLRFTRGLLRMRNYIRKQVRLESGDITYVLIPEHPTPYSFLHFIFFDKSAFEGGRIPDQVLAHEHAHARQKHSLDVLFIELLQILYWFNPFLVFYNKAIRLNHEYLADQAVLSLYADRRTYQQLLIHELAGRSSFLTSSFNYSQTKKRILMMNRIQTPKRFGWKLTALLPFLAATCYTLSGQTPRERRIPPPPPPMEAVEVRVRPANGLSEADLKAYQDMFRQHVHDSTDAKGLQTVTIRLTNEQRRYLLGLYRQMTPEQQRQQLYIPVRLPDRVKKSPDRATFESWKDPDIYGVWIDAKKVDNAVLDRYAPGDIAEFSTSRLYPNARAGKRYKIQLNLTTAKAFDATYRKRMEDNITIVMRDPGDGKKRVVYERR